MPLLETQRLFLRPYGPADTALLHGLMADSRVYFWRDAPVSRREAEAELEAKLALRERGLGYWAVFDQKALDHDLPEADAFLGQVCAQPLKFTDEIEFGYAFRPEAWGKGYATEASRALLMHIFTGLGLERLAAIVRPGNAPSLAVMERLGFTARHEGLYGTSQTLHRYFELTRTEFEATLAAGE